MHRIKVVHLLYSLEMGGAERLVLSIVKHLDRSKYDGIIYSFKGGSLERELIRSKINYHVVGKKSRFDAQFPLKLHEALTRERVQVLHCHLFSPNFWGRIVGKVCGIKSIITTEHSMAYRKSFSQKVTERMLCVLSSKIVAVSEAVRQSQIDQGKIPPERIVTIRNGLEVDAVTAAANGIEGRKILRDQFGVKDDELLILSVGRLIVAKGYENLLLAMPRILESVKKAKLIITGEGPLDGELKKLTQDLRISDKVIFTGLRHDVYNIIAASDLCVMSSVREGLSIALLEYMALGKPVVATDVGANAEVIEQGKSGLIVPIKSSNAIADAVINLINDMNAARRMGDSARQRINNNFNIIETVRQLENLYTSLV